MEMTSTHTDSKRRPALGKGIESLLGPRPQASAPPAQPPAAAPVPEASGKPLEIALDQIDRNPNQTRTNFDEAKLAELAQSISATGVVQPVAVRERPGGRYELIMGERRWRASQIAGKQTIPAIVRQVSDEQAMEMTIVENLQRADLNPMEQARAYARLSSEFKLTQEQMAQRTGKDRASISNFLRLLKLPESAQKLVESGELSFGHARAMLAIDSPAMLTAVTTTVLAKSMSVRQTEAFIQGLLNPEQKPKGNKLPAPPPQDPNVRAAEEQMQRRLGLRVHINDHAGKGVVVIEYSNVDEFDAILSALGE